MSWYEAQSPKTQATFDVRLDYLLARERHEWIRPQFDMLSGDGAGLGEVRFKANRTEHRVIGFFGPDVRFVFTLVACAVEKDGSFVPPTTIENANRRKNEILETRSRADVCECR